MSPAACSPVRVHGCGESKWRPFTSCLTVARLPNWAKSCKKQHIQKKKKLSSLFTVWKLEGRGPTDEFTARGRGSDYQINSRIYFLCTLSLYRQTWLTSWRANWSIPGSSRCACAWRTAPTCPGRGIELLYLPWLWIKGLNVSPQVSTAALRLIFPICSDSTGWVGGGGGGHRNNREGKSKLSWEDEVAAALTPARCHRWAQWDYFTLTCPACIRSKYTRLRAHLPISIGTLQTPMSNNGPRSSQTAKTIIIANERQFITAL